METVSKFWPGKLISKYRRVYSRRIGNRLPGICQTFNDESNIFSIQFVLSGNEGMDKGGQRGGGNARDKINTRLFDKLWGRTIEQMRGEGGMNSI